MRIENWSIIEDPQTGKGRLQGNVYDHYRFEDGEIIISSSICILDISNKFAITFSGSHYTLGVPNKEWIDWLIETKQTKYLSDLKKLMEPILN